jgi:hypothetical protein
MAALLKLSDAKTVASRRGIELPELFGTTTPAATAAATN